MDDISDQAQAEVLKLSEALRACQRELAQVRQEQEKHEEDLYGMREQNRELADRCAQLAGSMAGYLTSAYWHNRGMREPLSWRDFLLSHWPRLCRLIVPKPSGELQDEMRQVRAIQTCPMFDAKWYLERRPDVAASGVHPALHYLCFGGPENIDPGPGFDTRRYRREHPDLAPDANPLIHYLQARNGLPDC